MSAVPLEHRNENLAAQVWESLYIALISLSPALLGAVLISDGLYCLTAAAICAWASVWLLGAVSATGLMAAGDEIIRHMRIRRSQRPRIRWMPVIGNALSLLLSLTNLTYRLIEGAGSSVVPTGIALTGTVVCLLIATTAPGLGPSLRATNDDSDDEDLL